MTGRLARRSLLAATGSRSGKINHLLQSFIPDHNLKQYSQVTCQRLKVIREHIQQGADIVIIISLMPHCTERKPLNIQGWR